MAKIKANPCQDTWQLYVSLCPLHVPVSTSLTSLLLPANLCLMHPATLHQATISLDAGTVVPSLSTSWPVMWTGLSKLYFSGRLLCDVFLSEGTELHDQTHLLATQMGNEIKRRKFGSDHPFCTGWGSVRSDVESPQNPEAVFRLCRHTPTHTSLLDSCLFIHTNRLTLSCQCWKTTISACCFNHNVLEIAFQGCHDTVQTLQICLQSYKLFYTAFTKLEVIHSDQG